MSGHTANALAKTHCYVARAKPGYEKWMSVLSHNAIFEHVESIFVTGLVPGGYAKELRDAHTSPTCRFPDRIYGLGKLMWDKTLLLW